MNKSSPRNYAIPISLFLSCATLYWAAHSFQWTSGWTYVGTHTICSLTCALVIAVKNPILFKRRTGIKKGTKKWDYGWTLLFTIVLFALIGLSAQEMKARAGTFLEPDGIWLAGLGFTALGWTIATWAMTVNPFFEKTVRIQTDNEHQVVDSGPYIYVRHPGYVGFNLIVLGIPCMLQSMVAAVPAGILVILFIIRTVFEDRTLQNELDGYSEFAQRTPYRLIPRIW